VDYAVDGFIIAVVWSISSLSLLWLKLLLYVM